MQTITDYTVIHGTIADGSFERLVAARLSAGYQPYGSPFFSRENARVAGALLNPDKIFCHQAMVKQTNDATLSKQIPDNTGLTGTQARYLR